MTSLFTFRVAVRALLRNKTRSLLTTLGVVIGVAAFIATVALGAGAQARVAEAFAAMGTNLLVVFPGSFTAGGARGGAGSASTLTWDDLAAIRAEVPAVRTAAAELRASAQLVSDSGNWSVQVTGTSAEWFDVKRWFVASGRAIEAGDVEGRAPVVVLGRTTADRLFGEGVDPVGETVRVRSAPLTVVGVLAKKGRSAMGQDQDDTAILPATTFQSRLQGRVSSSVNGAILVSAVSAEETTQAQADVTALLRDRHRIEPGGEDDFSVGNLAELADSQQQSARTLATLLASIAAVSLLVGGVGIMNIMLVSVTERTREIGLRAAVGAKPSSLLLQFLTEAVVLSLLGGAAGIALGVGASVELSRAFGWSTVIQPAAVLASLGFSATVGIVFGLYPAVRASRLDPIAALRWE